MNDTVDSDILLLGVYYVVIKGFLITIVKNLPLRIN